MNENKDGQERGGGMAVNERDLLSLVDELDAFLSDSGRIPLTGRLVVNEQEAFELVDQLRQSIPEALRIAQRITRDREKLLQQARQEGDQLLSDSRAYAEKLTRESSIIQRAQEEADRIIEDARRIGREIRMGARDYADEIMERVEGNILRALAIVREGRQELVTSQAAAAAEDPPGSQGAPPSQAAPNPRPGASR